MDIESIVKLIASGLVILIPATWGLGLVIKATKLDNGFIPMISVFIITALAVLGTFATADTSTSQLVAAAWFAGITQGIVAWLVGWWSYNKFIKSGLTTNNDGKG